MEDHEVEPSGKANYSDRTTKILAALRAIQGNHFENNLLICRNHIAEALESFKQQTTALTDKDPQFYIHYFDMEQRVAFELLNLFEHSQTTFRKKNTVREKVSEITRQFYAEPLVAKDYSTDVVRDALIRQYQFKHRMMQFCENPRTVDREKFQVLALLQHVINFSEKNAIPENENLAPLYNKLLAELSHCENFSPKMIQTILSNHILAVRRLALEGNQKYLQMLEESAQRLLDIPPIVNLSSARGENRYTIHECLISEGDLGESEEHIFYAGEEDKIDAQPITENTVFALVTLGVGLLASSRRVSLKSDVMVTTEGYIDARRKAKQNTVWVTQARAKAIEVVREWDGSGHKLNQKPEDPHMQHMFNLTIQGKLRGESAVRQVFFIAVNGALGMPQQVCCYSLKQAQQFIRYLKSHPFCYDQQYGWTMGRYGNVLSTEENLIVMLCNTLASYLQSPKNHLEKPLNVAMVQEIKGLMAKIHQAEDHAAVLVAFNHTKQFCVNLIKLEVRTHEDHVIYQLLNRIESHLRNVLDKPLKRDSLYEKLNRLVEMDMDPYKLLGIDFFYTPQFLQKKYQELLSAQGGKVNVPTRWAYEVLLKYPYNQMLEEAVVKSSQFEPGTLSRLLEVDGEFAPSQAAIDKAYGRCLHEYMEGERDIGELHEIQKEYEFLSHPLQRKAWIERKWLMSLPALPDDLEPPEDKVGAKPE